MNSLSHAGMAMRLDASIELEARMTPDATVDAALRPPEADDLLRPSREVALLRVRVVSSMCAGDAAIYLAVWAAMLPIGSAAGLMPRAFALIGAVSLALFWAQGLYPGYRLHGYEILKRRCLVTLRVAAVAVAGAFLLGESWQALLVAIFLAAALAVQPLMRSFVRGLLWRSGIWGEPAAILGDPSAAADLSDYFRLHWQYGVRPQPAGTGGDPPLALIAGAQPSRRDVARLCRRFADVILLADFPGVSISGLRPSEIGGEIGLRLGGTAERSALAGLLQRVLDFVAAAIGIVMLLPLLLASAVAIYVVDPAPVIYRQTREGQRGRPFQVLKLRTMYRDADARLEAMLAANPEARANWDTHFKLKHDPRILPGIGQFLRATSIDELPQLWNVLVGEMRLVGPRPFPIYHLAAMDQTFRVRRRSVVPGLTGLWQITGRSDADLGRQQQLDDFYIDNRSFWFDVHVLVKTIPAVVRGDGAY